MWVQEGGRTALGMFNFGGRKASPATRGIPISQDEKAAAVTIWMDANDFLPSTAPSYMSEAEIVSKFCVIANAIKDSKAAFAMINNDPIVFSFSDNKLQDSFRDWSIKLESEEKARRLLVRAPALMSLSNQQVLEAGQDAILQSFFWSYVGEATRMPTKALLALLKPVKRAMMNN